MKRIDRVAEYVRSSLWVIPAAGVVLAVAAGFATVALDQGAETRFGFGGNAEAARSVLSTIAAAMITFTGLVFSITIVALQLASGQFSPRVMRTFLRDRTSKLALAIFVATFSYAFTVLRATRAEDIPGVSVTLAIVLVFASVLFFIHYINHTAHSIRVAAIIESVAAEARLCIERNYPAERPPQPLAPDLPGEPVVILNEEAPGVITGFDADGIVARATQGESVVVLRAGVGDFLPHGSPLLDLHGAESGAGDYAALISVGRERTMQQDAPFGFRQLVDIAVKALSPGINDPTTAVQAIDQIHDLLRRLAGVPFSSGRATDERGVVRLVYPTPSWEDFVSLATDEIRIYGAGSVQVLRRLRAMLEDLLELAPEPRRPPLREQLVLLSAAAEREFDDERDRRVAGLADWPGSGL